MKPKTNSELQSHVEIIANSYYELEGELCRRDLFHFVKFFWPELVPGSSKMQYNWHIKYLCRVLQKAAQRVIDGVPKKHDIVINVPPGTTKSTIVSRAFPVWVWLNAAWIRIISSSHTEGLALDLSNDSLQLMATEKFKQCFPYISMRKDLKNKSMFGTYVYDKKTGKWKVGGGKRVAVGSKTSVIGKHADIHLIDDPIDPEGMYSVTEADTVNRWITETLGMRKTDKNITVTILVMQRLGFNDPSEYMRSKSNEDNKVLWINLPGTLFEDDKVEVHPKKLIKYYKDGFLDPVRLDKKACANLLASLGSRVYSTQVLQLPKSMEGEMFKSHWFEIVEDVPPDIEEIRTYDLAGTKEKLKDLAKNGQVAKTVGIKMGYSETFKRYYITDYKHCRKDPYGVFKFIETIASQDGEDMVICIPQDPGQAGNYQVQSYAHDLAKYKLTYSVESGSKESRAYLWATKAEAGLIKIVRADWNQTLLNHITSFPNAGKDEVDAISRAYKELAEGILMECGTWGD